MAKSMITLNLSNGPLAEVILIVDDYEKTAKEVYNKLDSAYCMSSWHEVSTDDQFYIWNMQMIIIIQQEVETRTLDHDKE